MGKIKSSLMGFYVKTEETGDDYNRIGATCDALTFNLNPSETETASVTMDVVQTALESYKPTLEGTNIYDDSDPFLVAMLAMYRKQAVLDDSKRDLVVVHMFEEGDNADLYEECTVFINSINLVGAEAFEVDINIATNTSPKEGTVVFSEDKSTLTFVPSASSEG